MTPDLLRRAKDTRGVSCKIFTPTSKYSYSEAARDWKLEAKCGKESEECPKAKGHI
jgi:hypothetical protein